MIAMRQFFAFLQNENGAVHKFLDSRFFNLIISHVRHFTSIFLIASEYEYGAKRKFLGFKLFEFTTAYNYRLAGNCLISFECGNNAIWYNNFP